MISPETIKHLLDYCTEIASTSDELLVKKDATKEEKIFWSLACLVEECGELTSEVRKKYKMTFSKKKVSEFREENLEDEYVDTLITLFILGKELWLENLDEAVRRKIKKNDERGYRVSE